MAIHSERDVKILAELSRGLSILCAFVWAAPYKNTKKRHTEFLFFRVSNVARSECRVALAEALHGLDEEALQVEPSALLVARGLEEKGLGETAG